jgi:hypothetical protein
MNSDARRLAILSAGEVNDLYGLPRGSEEDRYCLTCFSTIRPTARRFSHDPHICRKNVTDGVGRLR